MSLRCVGNQLLQTGPSTLLSGASKASLSLWVCVNSGSNVSNPNGVEIFGDAGGKLSATLSGTGSLRLGWSSQNGNTSGNSSCVFSLVPGTSYHLAAVWQGGSQQYYLDGVLVQADTQAGSIGIPGDAAPHPYRIGSDSAGTDVSVGDPTLWVGYALSPQDVLNLRDRAVQPSAIAPSSIALEWPLAGPDGIAVKVGDAGLADASPTGLNLTSVVGAAPTYQAAVLTYVAPHAIGRAMVAGSGQSIALVFQDASGNPTPVTAAQSGDDVQAISLANWRADGTVPVPYPAADGSFTLTFGGRTTTPIPFTVSDPATYATFTFPVTPGRPIRISTTWLAQGFPDSQEPVLAEIIDGPSVVATGSYNLELPPASFTFQNNPAPGDGSPVSWQSLGTVTPSSSTIVVRFTGGFRTAFFLDAVLVQDVADDATWTVHDDADPGTFFIAGDFNVIHDGRYWKGTGTQAKWDGVGFGAAFLCDPAAVQSAIQALSTVQPQSVRVTAADGHLAMPTSIEFINTMGGQTQPAITSSSPSVSIAHTPGGVSPSMTINGGPPVPLKTWVAAGEPWAICPLHQASPAVQTLRALVGNFTTAGSFNSTTVENSVSARVFSSSSTGNIAYFPAQALSIGDYQIAVTWPASLTGLSTTAKFLVQDAGGNPLAAYTVDQTVAPDDYQDQGVGWKVLGKFSTTFFNDGLTVAISTDGSTQPVALDAVQLTRTSADSSIVVNPGDVVEISVPGGFFATAAGPIGAVSGLAMTNLSGGSTFPPFDAGPKTMGIGYNTVQDAYYFDAFAFSNMAVRMPTPIGIASNSDGYPLKIGGAQVGAVITMPASGTRGNGKSQLNAPNGRYTILWDGASDVTMFGIDTACTEVAELANITHGAGNRRVFDVQANEKVQYAPWIDALIHGTTPDPADPTGATYLCDIANLRIYPPDPTDPTGSTAWAIAGEPPKFHPSYLYKLQGARCIRFLDSMNANNNPYREFVDIKPSTALTRCEQTRGVQATILKCEPYVGPALDYPNRAMIKVTTSEPHALFTGLLIFVYGAGTASFSDGTQHVLDANAGATGYGFVTVLDDTSFVWHFPESNHPAGTVMTNTTAGGFVTTGFGPVGGSPAIGTCLALEDVTDLCNAVGADCWFNVPVTISDDCMTQVAAYLAAHLNPGLKVHLEYGNECWNGAFQTSGWMQIMNFQLSGVTDGSYAEAYVVNAMRVHDLAAAAFSAAGRPADLIRTFATQAANPGVTDSIGGFAATHGARIAEIATAPYFNNVQSWPTNVYMTTGQCLDVLELQTQYDAEYNAIATHHKLLASHGFSGFNDVCYEGGPESLMLGSEGDVVNGPYLRSNPVNANAIERTHAIHRHPRMYGIILHYLQRLQDQGVTLFNDYFAMRFVQSYSWSAYEWYNQQRGTGDPSIDAVNVSDPEAMDTVKSEVGGAIYHWNSLVPPTAKPRRYIPLPLRTTGQRAW